MASHNGKCYVKKLKTPKMSNPFTALCLWNNLRRCQILQVKTKIIMKSYQILKKDQIIFQNKFQNQRFRLNPKMFCPSPRVRRVWGWIGQPSPSVCGIQRVWDWIRQPSPRVWRVWDWKPSPSLLLLNSSYCLDFHQPVLQDHIKGQLWRYFSLWNLNGLCCKENNAENYIQLS